MSKLNSHFPVTEKFFENAGVNDLIHLVGVSGTEMSSLLSYLHQRGFSKTVLHDFAPDFNTSFEVNHHFYPLKIKQHYRRLINNTGEVLTGQRYLEGIGEADHIFVPQSWFLYKENEKLYGYRDKLRFFHNICFELFPGRIIAVTGTIGKSTTSLYTSILTGGLLTGNDRENIFDLDNIEKAGRDDIMVFELSNRHLKNGITALPDIGVLTAICPNHIPDHGSLEEYAKIKNSIFNFSERTVYNASNPCPHLRILPKDTNSYSYSIHEKADACINDGMIMIRGNPLCHADRVPLTFTHEYEDFLAACLAATLAGTEPEIIKSRIPGIKTALRFRCERTGVKGKKIINDAASCLPECTRALLGSINEPCILITGDSRQHPLDDEFDQLAAEIAGHPGIVRVFITGIMKNRIKASLDKYGFDKYIISGSLEEAVKNSLSASTDTIIFSPGCGPGKEYGNKYQRGELFDELIRKYG